MTLTITTRPDAGPRATERWPRAAAVASVACLLTHGALLSVTGAAMLAMVLPMLALSALCACCAPRLWRGRCGTTDLVLVLAAGSTMVAVHLLLAPMHSAGTNLPVSGAADVLMHGGLMLAIVSELIAGASLARRLMASH